MAAGVQVLLALFWTLLDQVRHASAENKSATVPTQPQHAVNASEAEELPRVQAARQTHMVEAGGGGSGGSASPAGSLHPLLTLLLLAGVGAAVVATAVGLRSAVRRMRRGDRLGSYRYFKVSTDDDGELAELNGEYHMALDDSSEDELGPARLPVNTPETAEIRRSCPASAPPEVKSLLIESSDEEMIQ